MLLLELKGVMMVARDTSLQRRNLTMVEVDLVDVDVVEEVVAEEGSWDITVAQCWLSEISQWSLIQSCIFYFQI